MNDHERAIIKRYANGDHTAYTYALEIFYRELEQNGVSLRGDPYFDFMSEVDSPMPCWVLKSEARKKILEDK